MNADLQMQLTVLVVDDNPAVNDVLCQLCEYLGHQVISAANGDEGLALLAARDDVDLVFTDFKMPGADGMEVLLRAKAQRPQLPVVLITGSVVPDVAEIQQAGFDAVLRKPFELQAIAALIGRLFPGHNHGLGD